MINNDNIEFKGETVIKDGEVKKMKQATVNTSYSHSRNYIGLFKLILLIGFGFITIKILFSGNTQIFSFQTFLEQLQSLPEISTSFKSFFERALIITDWGWFNFFRDFINSLMSVFSVVSWLFGALLDVIKFIVAFLKMIFV